MNPFFIASLPRSRTAWLANFLTTGDSFCFHEPMNRTALSEYPRLLADTGKRYAGISDSLNSLIMEELIDFFPDAKVVVIRRPLEDVEASLAKLNFKCPVLLRKIERELDRIIHAYKPLVVEFESFDPARIWKYLIPDIPLDRKRLKMLEEFTLVVPRDIIVLKGMELMAKAGDLLWPMLA